MQNLSKLQTAEEKLDFLFKKYAELVRSLISSFCQKLPALVKAKRRWQLLMDIIIEHS